MPDDIDKDFRQLLIAEIRYLRVETTAMRVEIQAELSDLKTNIAQLQAREAERWGPLRVDILDIKNRLSELEQKDVKALDRRIDQLERADVTNKNTKEQNKALIAANAALTERVLKLEKRDLFKYGVSAGLGLASSGGGFAVFKYLFGG
jgi:uncharacterized coiled-coil DUF342 family protein